MIPTSLLAMVDRETFTSAGIVLVVISIAAIILMLLDQFFSFIVRIVLG